MRTTDLPIESALGPLIAALIQGTAAVLVAQPGAGKTTIVPLVLIEQPWCTGKVIVVEPRRVAARAAASRLAALLGERVGDTVGWRMRGDTKVGRATRIEVVTDGVLTRMLQTDPSLDGVSCVVLDEFHERSLDIDLGLALCIDAQQGLRDDLRLLVMSATIDAGAVAELLSDASVIEAAGRTFPVTTRWLGPATPKLQPRAIAEAIRLALAESDGDVLAFLPGAREIRAVERDLGSVAGVVVLPLHGALPSSAQDRALGPAPDGRRKVVLSTNIAETSLTIEGVTAVVDSGWARRSVADSARAMSGLVTMRISRASADQRRGRAGRVRPGLGYRLWAEHEHALLDEHDPPEITQADLVPLALDLARWGAPDGSGLRWLTAPPPRALVAARGLLETLGVLEPSGQVTTHGRSVAALPTHPRLAHAMLRAREHGHGALACTVAALLGDRDIGDDRRDADLASRIDALRTGTRTPGVDRVRRDAERLRRRLGVAETSAFTVDHLGVILAFAYPDRVARRREQAGRYLLANGVGAAVAEHDNLSTSEWLAVAEVELLGDGGDARILLAAPITREELDLAIEPTTATVAQWDRRTRDVRVQRERRIGAIVLKASPFDDPDAARHALVDGVRIEGLALLPRLDDASTFRERVAFCRGHIGEEWPDLSDDALLEHLDEWLHPALVSAGARRRADLARVDLLHAIRAMVPWSLLTLLDQLAPTHVTTAKGTRKPVDYSGDDPSISLRIQDAFGWYETPKLAGGRVPLVVALLSPANRPVQVTRDLAGFWRGSYKEVRAELRGRYPKHAWPEDPTADQAGRGPRR